MRRLLLAVFLLGCSPSFAQQPPREYTLRLSTQDIQYLGSVLVERPYKEVNVLLQRMQQQINEQAVAPKPDEPKKETPDGEVKGK